MEVSHPPRPPTRRAALSDSTRRAVNASHRDPGPSAKEYYSNEQYEARQRLYHTEYRSRCAEQGIRLPDPNYYPPPPADYKPVQQATPASEERRARVPKQQPIVETIQEPFTQTTRENKRKTHIGPWNLGRDLGKGATSRVRLARHAVTGQLVAVKIVPKRMARLTQAGSLASLDIREADLQTPPNTSRLPYSIEREVAIMKLIQHPHILQLIDIWENHNEIYLVLEYVDGGELFHFIGERGRLLEEVAVKVFRQVLSAVGYCHKLRICHRDLKPENILLTKDEDVKIADFGMAALHQTSDHKLRTSCGSPHYAAPEIMQGIRYRGDRADIWSMGVILYACMVGGLPFDARGDDSKEITRELARLVIRGEYFMPPQLSLASQDLIRRILRVNPSDRISISQMWRHPLIRQYDYLDDLNPSSSGPQSLELKVPECPQLDREEIDPDILRHLKSMWHSFTEAQIVEKLISPSANDQKMFYHLFIKYRESQLEDYGKNFTNSPSDYHHIRPLKQVKKLTTRQFTRPNAKGPARSGSRFTIISNAAETVKSYDPYNAYRSQTVSPPAEYANITIYRDNPPIPEICSVQDVSVMGSANLLGRNSRPPSIAPGSRRFLAARGYTTRSSMSSTRSRGGTPVVKPNIGHKRPVNFSYIRQGSYAPSKASSSSRLRQVVNDADVMSPTNASTRGDNRSLLRNEHTPDRDDMSVDDQDAQNGLWKEVIQISSSLAKDCDEAFNPSVQSKLDELTDSIHTSPGESTSRVASRPVSGTSWRKRPLPAAPAQAESVSTDSSDNRKDGEYRRASSSSDTSSHLQRMVSHLDRLVRLDGHHDRRVVSAPARPEPPKTIRLPSIYEAPTKPQHKRSQATWTAADDRAPQRRDARIGSAPTRWSPPYGFDEEKLMNNKWTNELVTIRVVNDPPSPARPPPPLNIRKKSSFKVEEQQIPVMSGGLGQTARHQQDPRQLEYTTASYGSPDDTFNPGGSKRNSKDRKASWLRYGIKAEDIEPNDYDAVDNMPAPSAKKKGFGLSKLFKRKSSKTDIMPAFGIYDDSESIPSVGSGDNNILDNSKKRNSWNIRQVEPRQNWLARLFRIKPATKSICFAVSKRRARQEIGLIFRQWRKFGIEDVVIDKQRNMVFAKVGPKNMAGIKPVALAAEVMTVIEHGKKRQPLSIARFTQEHGAASSFHRVINQLAITLQSRGMLVSDERKARMMIQTLNG